MLMMRGEANVKRASRGFTLTEMIVVVLLVGILAAFAVPQYMKSVESGKADEGAALMNMVGTTNRMYALDHQGTYTAGAITTGCNGSVCPTASITDPCALVACKYLAAQDFDQKPYTINSADGDPSHAAAACQGLGGGHYTACAKRRTGGSPGTNNTNYTGYGYTVDNAGSLTAYGNAPQPVQ